MAANPTQVQQYLGGIKYPCSKADLVSHAREEHASKDVIGILQRLPYDEFNSPADVSLAIGQVG